MSFGLLEHFRDLTTLTKAINFYAKKETLHIHVIIPKKFSTEVIVNGFYFPFKLFKNILRNNFKNIIQKSFRDFPHFENRFTAKEYQIAFQKAGSQQQVTFGGSFFYPFFALPRPFDKIITKFFSKKMYKLFYWSNMRSDIFSFSISPQFTYVGINKIEN